jgi:hypothetical protein
LRTVNDVDPMDAERSGLAVKSTDL